MSRIMALSVLSYLVLSGCAPHGDWAGYWEGVRPIETPPDGSPLVARSLGLVKLRIRTDGHFDLTEETFGKSGQANLGGDSGTLVIDTVLGRRVGNLGPSGEKMAGERRVKLQKDGTILFERPGSDPLVLKRTVDPSESAPSGAQ